MTCTPAADPQPEAYAAVIPMLRPIGSNALQPTKRKIPFFILPFSVTGTGGGSSLNTP